MALNILFPILLAVSAVLAPSARAIESYEPGNVADLLGVDVEALLKTVVIGANHRPLVSAKPLGMGLGLEFGLDVAVIATPAEFKEAIAKASDVAGGASEIPALIPLPRFHIRKGFPKGFDLGFSYVSYQDIFRVYGADLQWTFIRKSPISPLVAARFTAAYIELLYMRGRNFGFDLVASKSLAILDPYVGVGLQIWNGSLDVPVSGPGGLSASVAGNTSATNPHIFVGLPLKLVFLKWTMIELDHSFSGVTTYGSKLSLSF